MMRISDALWEVFKTTGHVGVYLLYKHYYIGENESEQLAAQCPGCSETIS